MKRENVTSSNIKSIGYEKETQTLEIEFTTGTVYQYLGINEETHKALISADSIGKFFNKEIKGKPYPFLKIYVEEKAND